MTPDAPAPPRRGAARWVRRALGLLAVGLLLAAAWSQRAALADAAGRIDAGRLVLAGLLVLLGLWTNMLSWRAVLAGLGSPLALPAAARVYLVAQIGKYLPGSLWPVLAQAELGREHGVPRVRSGVAAVAALVVGLVVGAVLAAAALGATATGAAREYWWVLLAVPVGLVALAPPVLQRLLDLALRLARRDADPHRVEGAALLRGAWWSAVTWVVFGAHVALLADALGADGRLLLVLCTGAYAVAWTVGFLVVVAPAGAGAREGALVLALAPVLERADALAVALLSRGLMLVGDLLAVGLALLGHRASRPRPGHRRTPP
ncbi:lysylphosphatidylglycerol synthase domain-containing protein [Vallicoccus soli]|uniref:UPF0104 family protein n=1 Tax=Vallicoccus soli TaxID=2339232 RepID=A0A3A3Z1L1_9ACTN|nr:lysylphosphatidylglycerol synthase domain-containing protein [Vallicoccus soli]RJK95368.1 UPF0104 family protein [Vallicoccus soli]